MKFEKLLSGGDLRSIGKCDEIVLAVKTQEEFDKLFTFLFHKERVVVMRAADAIEKITATRPEYLLKHKKDFFHLFDSAENKELMWHIALMASRFPFTKTEFTKAWNGLVSWLTDKSNSKLVRVAALQGLYEMAGKERRHMSKFLELASEVQKDNIPSVNARIRNIRKEIASEKMLVAN